MKNILLTVVLALGVIGGAYASTNLYSPNKLHSLNIKWNIHDVKPTKPFVTLSFGVIADNKLVEPSIGFVNHHEVIVPGSKILRFNGPISHLVVQESFNGFNTKGWLFPPACQEATAKALRELNQGKNVEIDISGVITGDPVNDLRCRVRVAN